MSGPTILIRSADGMSWENRKLLRRDDTGTGWEWPSLVTEVIVDDKTTGTGKLQWDYSAGWSTSTTEHYSSTTGATATIRFQGTSIGIYGKRAAHHGKMSVSIDGGPAVEVDCYASSSTPEALLFDSGTLADANHTIICKVTGTKNASSTGYTVAVNYAKVMATDTQMPNEFSGPTPTIDYRVVSPTGKVATGHTGTVNSVRLVVATDEQLTQNVVLTNPVSVNAQGTAKHTLPALTPGTWYYRVAVTVDAGEGLDANANIGRIIITDPKVDTLSWLGGSCTNGSDSTAVGHMATRSDPIILQYGDLWYADGTGTGIANFRSKMRTKLAAANHHKAFARSGISITPSDHDGMNDDSTAGNDPTAWANYNQAFRELLPIDVPASGVYHTWDEGPVRFIVWDTRSFKTISSATDDSNKHALGAEQEAWTKNLLDTLPSDMIAVIVSDSPWHGAAEVGEDAWVGYTTARTRIGNMIAGTKKPVMMISGDAHMIGYDDGRNNPVGGFPMYVAAPLNNTSSHKPSASSYSGGVFPTSTGVASQQYGRWTVTRTATQISVDFKGYNGSGTQVYSAPTHTFSISSEPPTGTEVIVQDTSTGTSKLQWDYSAGWSTSTTEHYSSTANATATLRFQGTSAAIYGKRDVHHGRMSISIDGGPAVEVDCYASSPTPEALLFDSGTLTDATHTVICEVTGTKNASSTGYTVAVNYAKVMSTDTQTPTGALPWAPPNVTWQVKHISNSTIGTSSPRTLKLGSGNWHIIFDEPITRRLLILGGNHLKIVGGEFNINVNNGGGSTAASWDDNCGLQFGNQTGTVFIEGLWVHGTYAMDSIRSGSSENSDVVIQNCRLESDRIVTGVSGPTDKMYHTDGIQFWSGVRTCKVYNTTICNPYQGGMIGDGALDNKWGTTIWDHVNMKIGPTAGQATRLLNFVDGPSPGQYFIGPFTFKDVYYQPAAKANWGTGSPTVIGVNYDGGAFYSHMKVGTDSQGRQYGQWDTSNYTYVEDANDGVGGPLRCYKGLPPDGDYCKDPRTTPTAAGMKYVSPGYM